MDEVRFRHHEEAVWRAVGVVPSEQRIRLARTRVTVRVQEVGTGPPVLFVHGASNGGTSWAELVSRLDGFRCLALDRPGCALSDPLPAPRRRIEELEEYADALVVDVLDALGLERAHVVATSYGGYFAVRGAAANPDRVGRLVELGWMVGAPMSNVPVAMRVTAVPGVGRATTVIPPSERAVRMILRQVGLGRALDSGAFSPVAVAWFTSLLRDTPTMRNELSATPRVIRPIRGADPRVVLSTALRASMRTPTLFLWGDEDPGGDAASARAFVAPFPDARLEIVERAGHAPWIDWPDEVAAAVATFLRGPAG